MSSQKQLATKCPEVIDCKPVYVVWVNSDLTEGRGWDVPLVSCETEATARRLAKGRNVQGSNGTITREWALKTSRGWLVPGRVELPSREDDINQAAIETHRAIVEKAKAAGLTDDEIEVLKGVGNG